MSIAPLSSVPLAKSALSTHTLPPDVVKLHQHPDIRAQIIVQFLDP